MCHAQYGAVAMLLGTGSFDFSAQPASLAAEPADLGEAEVDEPQGFDEKPISYGSRFSFGGDDDGSQQANSAPKSGGGGFQSECKPA